MATHFSANQYENAFAANRLQNYQIPNIYKKHPTAREGATQIVSNDRGHLITGIPRSKESPWGNFEGTWDDQMAFTKQKTTTVKQATKKVTIESNPEKCLKTPPKSATPERGNTPVRETTREQCSPSQTINLDQTYCDNEIMEEH